MLFPPAERGKTYRGSRLITPLFKERTLEQTVRLSRRWPLISDHIKKTTATKGCAHWSPNTPEILHCLFIKSSRCQRAAQDQTEASPQQPRAHRLSTLSSLTSYLLYLVLWLALSLLCSVWHVWCQIKCVVKCHWISNPEPALQVSLALWLNQRDITERHTRVCAFIACSWVCTVGRILGHWLTAC